MGLFKKDKKSKEVSFSTKVKSSIEMGTDDEYHRLLKEAANKKKNGDIDGAIKILRSVYDKLNSSGMMFSIETYLRLPLYLQEAGRRDEAWSEFNNLVLWVNSKPRYSSEVTPMDLSAIWDKMRLVLQRENRSEYAITFSIWSCLSWAMGLHKQNRLSELETYTTNENILKALNPLLKKASKESFSEGITRIVSESLKQLPDIDFKKIANQVKEELNK